MKISLSNPDSMTRYGFETQKKELAEFKETLPRIPEFKFYEDRKWKEEYEKVATAYINEKLDIVVIKNALESNLNATPYSSDYWWKWDNIEFIYRRNMIEIYIHIPTEAKNKEQRKNVFVRGCNEWTRKWVAYYQQLIPLKVFMENCDTIDEYEDTDDFEKWIEIGGSASIVPK